MCHSGFLKPCYVPDLCEFRALSESAVQSWVQLRNSEDREGNLPAAEFHCCGRAPIPLSWSSHVWAARQPLRGTGSGLLVCFLPRPLELSPRVPGASPAENLTTRPSLSLCLCSVFPAPGAREWWLRLPPAALQRPPQLRQCHRVPVCRRLHVKRRLQVPDV